MTGPGFPIVAMHTTASGNLWVGGPAPIGQIPGVALPGDVACVAKWRDPLRVGATRLGLFRRIGTTRNFETVKPKIDCVSMDARDELVMCRYNRVCGTADGVEFRSCGTNVSRSND